MAGRLRHYIQPGIVNLHDAAGYNFVLPLAFTIYYRTKAIWFIHTTSSGLFCFL
jgi:hypothetical protein